MPDVVDDQIGTRQQPVKSEVNFFVPNETNLVRFAQPTANVLKGKNVAKRIFRFVSFCLYGFRFGMKNFDERQRPSVATFLRMNADVDVLLIDEATEKFCSTRMIQPRVASRQRLKIRTMKIFERSVARRTPAKEHGIACARKCVNCLSRQ